MCSKPLTKSDASCCCEVSTEQWAQGDYTQRRALIITTAMGLLTEHDLKAVTMRRVAQRLGVGAMTLYTYIEGQQALRREMVRRGFQMLNGCCEGSSSLDTPEGWRGGALAYLRFAANHPNLYKLMFDTPMEEFDREALRGGFQPLLDKVRQRLAAEGLSGPTLDEEARARAGRFWIGLHGLATLTIADRLGVVGGDVEQILDDLLPHIAPT